MTRRCVPPPSGSPTRWPPPARRSPTAWRPPRPSCGPTARPARSWPATKLGLEAGPAEEPLETAARADLESRIERLRRRREQLGPVNPLAKQEYAEAIEHVEELERQREDLEAAMRELRGLIRDTD